MREAVICLIFIAFLAVGFAQPAEECNTLPCYSIPTPPSFSGAPADTTLDCDVDPLAVGNSGAAPTATDSCDQSVDVTTEVSYNVLCDRLEVTREFTAIDRCGNINVLKQVITVLDQISPEVTAPADVTLNLDGDCSVDDSVATLGGAVVTDNCDLEPAIEVHDTVTPGGCPGTYVTVREFKATDSCGNVGRAFQTITVVDSTLPTFTFVPADITVECGTGYSTATLGDAEAEDNCAGVVVTHEDDVSVAACGALTIERTFTATDACGNYITATQTITVIDTTAPTFTNVPASVTLQLDGSCNADIGPNDATNGEATATDTCGAAPTITFEDAEVTHCGLAQPRTITRTWRATDSCGNYVEATQTIEVVDVTEPTFQSVPADTTVECSAPLEPSATGEPVPADNCNSVSWTHADAVEASGQCGLVTITRTFTATDACGNAATASQVITVQDTTNPEFTYVPATVTLDLDASCGADIGPNAATGNSATATDTCDDAPEITFTDVSEHTDACGVNAEARTISRTWRATDSCGNYVEQTQTIVVQDVANPTFSFVPADITVECGTDVSIDELGNAQAEDNCAGVVVSHEDELQVADCGKVHVVRTFKATDACGNYITATQTITVIDTTAPSLSVPADVSLECEGGTSPDITGQATATDACDPAPVIEYEDFSEATCGSASVTRTWTATDSCGNTVSGTQVITSADTEVPVLTLDGPLTVTLQCTDSVDPASTGEATAADGCDPTPRVWKTESIVPGCGATFTVTRTWHAKDNCGNVADSIVQTLIVVDETAPVVTAPADTSVECTDSFSPENTGYATAQDVCDGELTTSYTDVYVPKGGDPQTTPFAATTGVITRTWSASDACGNSASAVQTITVVDTVQPVFTHVPADITLECTVSAEGTANTGGDATATDACSVPSVSYSDASSAGSCAQSQVITRTWTTVDPANNVNSAVQLITIVDSVAPEIQVNDYTTELTGSEDVSIGAAGTPTVSDNCDHSVQAVHVSDTQDNTCGASYTITRAWSVTDDCGNSNSVEQIITVQDTTAPTITAPASATIEAGSSTDPSALGSATATDLSEPITITYVDGPDGPAPPPLEKSFVRTWTATDACGNSATADQVIYFKDSTPPEASSEERCYWPPNKKFQCFPDVETTNSLIEATDVSQPVTRKFKSCDVSEGTWPYDTDQVCGMSDDGMFCIMVDRNWGQAPRYYTSKWEVTDSAGNKVIVTSKIKIPANQSKPEDRDCAFANELSEPSEYRKKWWDVEDPAQEMQEEAVAEAQPTQEKSWRWW